MRTKKIAINFIAEVIPLVIIAFLGIFKLKFFVEFLGDETLGLYQLFSQIMIYVALVDGGISSALLYSLYKPNTAKNDKKMSEILTAGKRCFSIIGASVFFLAFIVSLFIPYFIKDNSFSNTFVSISFLLFSISNVVSYFFVPYQTLFEVKEKKYVTTLSLQIGQIVQNALEILLLFLGVSFLYILVMHGVIKLISNLVIYILAKRNYPNIDFNSHEKDYKFTRQLKDLIVHKINGLVGSNIDILIITNMFGLKLVAIYSTYNYILNMIKDVLNKLSSSIVAILGNKLVEDEKESYNLFREMRSFLFYLATILCTSLLFAINPFINIWYEGKIKSNNLLALAFVLVLFTFVVKICTNVFINAKGLFKETKYCAITDTIVNLTLSILLAHKFGISGVVFATAFSVFIAEYILKTRVLFKEVFKKSSIIYHVENIKFFIILFLDMLLAYFITSRFTISNILVWFVFYTLFTIINAIFLLIIYSLLKETKFIERLKDLKGAKHAKN